jgi:2,3-diaminopropionate biosynthesis protein SbnB
MLYLNANDIDRLGTDWKRLIDIVRDTLVIIKNKDYAQPTKPYLRYGNLKNRIIAMPAYIGGQNPVSGIKWIASFHDNIYENLARANSITILNKFDTGMPICIINSNLVSAIRTASVSGLMIEKRFNESRNRKLTVGIVGFGPIGQIHLQMISSILRSKIKKVCLYDLREIETISFGTGLKDKIFICKSWEECYSQADIFIACTVGDKPYINRKPKKGALLLNISLRDFDPATRRFMDTIVVDDWDEVCREKTDIEGMCKYHGLRKEDTISFADFVLDRDHGCNDREKVTMFNPMGMAVFDIAIGSYYYRRAIRENIGSYI